MAYLTDAEEAVFYEQAMRIVKPGGYLIVTHSNELFDIFSLNRYTVDLFRKYFLPEKTRPGVESLLTLPNVPDQVTTYNIRENPLSYHLKLARYGFKEIRQEFINRHLAPPPLLEGEKTYPPTIGLSETDRWRLMFNCSTFGSCSVRGATGEV